LKRKNGREDDRLEGIGPTIVGQSNYLSIDQWSYCQRPTGLFGSIVRFYVGDLSSSSSLLFIAVMAQWFLFGPLALQEHL
jgi:hypothetical protein